jgi:predicted  nucleic acid-binding Zn-ribbon protein
MAVVKWVESKTRLLRKEYLRLRYDGMERHEIRRAYFNDNVKLFRDQLIDWELLSLDAEWEELCKMGKVAKPIALKKEEYLQRRLKGETRSQIARSLGISNQRFYELLKDWNIRELDAEERELELLAPVKQAKVVNERVAESNERTAEARVDPKQENGKWPDEVVNELERTEAGEDILKRMELRAAAQEKELANLQAAIGLWKHDAERKAEHIADLEAEITRFNQQTTDQATEIVRLREALSGATVIADHAGAQIKELQEEREALLQTIEQAVVNTDVSMITLQIPIMPVQIAVLERTRIYSTLEALSQSVEGAEIDRQRVAIELFELLQRVVNFVTADLTELLPGHNAAAFIHKFFKYYNEKHVEELSAIRKVG